MGRAKKLRLPNYLPSMKSIPPYPPTSTDLRGTLLFSTGEQSCKQGREPGKWPSTTVSVRGEKNESELGENKGRKVTGVQCFGVQ